MKFLCDRCKTRYSIADDRVRGKILKIRCKNCSAIITVRDGMDHPSVWVAPTGSDSAAIGASGMDGPSGAATARVARDTDAPAALHEEWFLSSEGHRAGPFGLVDAQAWVAARASEDDLFCWSEGFDDWLPIEKVSHFRGLRTKPSRRMPPPPPVQEPNGSLDTGSAAPEADGPGTLVNSPPPVPIGASAPAPLALDGGGGKAGGRVRPADSGVVSLRGASHGGVLARGHAGATAGGVRAGAKVGADARAVGDQGHPPTSVAKVTFGPEPLAAAPLAPAPVTASPLPRAVPRFDTGDADGSDSNGLAEAGFGKSLTATDRSDGPAPSNDVVPDDSPDDSSDGLAIGEVSRVVRLADIARQARGSGRKGFGPSPIGTGTGAIATIHRATGAVPSLGSLQPEEVNTFVGPPTGTDATRSQVFPPETANRRRRRVLLPLLLVVLGGVIAVSVVLLTSLDDGDGNAGGGATSNYENLGFQVDDPINRRVPKDPVVPGKGSSRPRWTPGTGSSSSAGSATGSQAGSNRSEVILGSDGRPLRELTPDEVFAMSARMQMGTLRCYQRAIKDDPFLTVKKIKATITITAAGPVSNVVLSDKVGTQLGNCLTQSIQRWPFRPSTAGIVSEISLVFEQR